MAFLDTLTASARSAWPVIQGGVSRGLSSRAIDSVLKSTFGRSIRRSTLLEMMRFAQGVERSVSYLKTVNLDKYPNPSRLPVAATKLLRRYSFTVRLRGYDTATGEAVERFVTVSTPDLLTRAEIQDTAYSIIEAEGENYPMEVEEVQLMSGVRSGDLGTIL